MTLSLFKPGKKHLWLCLLMAALVAVVSPACGDDPEDEPIPDQTEQPTPDEPQTPDEPTEPEEPEEPKKPDPLPPITEDDLLGFYVCVWEKVVTHQRLLGDEWHVTTDIHEGDELRKYDPWYMYPRFIRYNGTRYFLMDFIQDDLTKLYDKLDSKATGSAGNGRGKVQFDRGTLVYDHFKWEWHPNVSMILLMNGRKVAHRWVVTKFDGKTLEMKHEAEHNGGKGREFYTDRYARFERVDVEVSVDYTTPAAPEEPETPAEPETTEEN